MSAMNVVKNEMIDYNQSVLESPNYKYVTLPPLNNNGQAITLTSSPIQIKFAIPADGVYNYGLSYYQGTLNIPAQGPGNYIWLAGDVAFGLISYLLGYTANGTRFVDLQNANLYLKGPVKAEMSNEELINLDPETGINASDCLPNVNPALRNNMVNPAVPYMSSRAYTEPAYYNVYPANTPVVINFRIPFSHYKNTYVGLNKDRWHGGVITYLDNQMGPNQNIGYWSKNAITPTNGILSAANFAAGMIDQNNGNGGQLGSGAAANLPNITNFQCVMALNIDPASIKTATENALKAQYIPFVRNDETPMSSANQTVVRSYSISDCSAVMKIYHQVYNNVRLGASVYDCGNDDTLVSNAVNATQAKVATFNTALNGQNEQDLLLNCTSTNLSGNGCNLDYMYLKPILKHSVLQDKNVYYYNWMWISDYLNAGPDYHQANNNELWGGKPCGVNTLYWSFKPNMVGFSANGINTNLNYLHETFSVLARKMQVIQGSGITFVDSP